MLKVQSQRSADSSDRGGRRRSIFEALVIQIKTTDNVFLSWKSISDVPPMFTNPVHLLKSKPGNAERPIHIRPESSDACVLPSFLML